VLIVLNADHAADVVRACIDRQVQHIWLFKGLGGPGAESEETIGLCREAGVNVVEGACPLMFLEPVGVGHRIHRGLRRLNRSLVTTG
jgi:predicted CoA-binding protein